MIWTESLLGVLRTVCRLKKAGMIQCLTRTAYGGNMGKSVNNLFKFYLGYDLKVRMKQYENARHEILNEPIKEMVYEDILNFIEEK